jgi:hypothetical protein
MFNQNIHADVDVEDEVFERIEDIIESSDTEDEFEEKETGRVEEELSQDDNQDDDQGVIIDLEPRESSKDTYKEAAESDQVSTPVSGNQAQVPTETDLLSNLKTFIEAHKNKDPKKITNREEVVEQAQSFIQQYFQHNDLNTTTLAEERIIFGQLLNVYKKIVKKPGRNWKDFFDQHYDKKQRRSAQYWMQVAEFNDAISYAPLGIDRLLKVVRKIKNNKTAETPIGDFLQENSLNINFDDPKSVKDAKDKVDGLLKAKKVKRTTSIEKEFPKLVNKIQASGSYFSGHAEAARKIKDAFIEMLEETAATLRHLKSNNSICLSTLLLIANEIYFWEEDKDARKLCGTQFDSISEGIP